MTVECLFSGGNRVGYFRFLEVEKGLKDYQHLSWVAETFGQLRETPYSGQAVGMIEFTSLLDSHSSTLVLRMSQIARGAVIHLERPESAFSLIRQEEPLSRFLPNPDPNFPWLVAPPARKPIKYLSDIVDKLNAALLPLCKVKENRRNHTKFISYSLGQTFYLFILNYEALGWSFFPEEAQKSFISVWQLNVYPILSLAE